MEAVIFVGLQGAGKSKLQILTRDESFDEPYFVRIDANDEFVVEE